MEPNLHCLPEPIHWPGRLTELVGARAPRETLANSVRFGPKPESGSDGSSGLSPAPLRGHQAMAVSANWRVTFRFDDGDVVDVAYVDYH